ncbi:peptidoglycan DD-metalloendopeptidase family protein [Streptomyces triticagri]|uniref:peptidoglycan DD-metalloendopeptidase family protein n=1 Tax=Streptomyces triticagri TaxID=2293568 RepID=UPI0026A68B8D|nr:peptidoglycan DD-metalloendopeptidase family protein [Streptomyces triticagri]
MNAWSMPVGRARVTTAYKKPGAWAAGFHTGVDFAVPTGTPVVAVGPGSVVVAGNQGAYGNCVIVGMTDGKYTLYAHLSRIEVKVGQKVTGGHRLGLSGATGNVTGPHLHFEARTTNTYNGHTDPLAYLAAHGVGGTGKPAKAPAKKAAGTYTVKAGDTLGAIAAAQLGNAARHPEIAALNGIADPNLIKVGQKLKLPPK